MDIKQVMAFFQKRTASTRTTEDADVALLNASDLFDPEWYSKQNPDVVHAGIPATVHYVRHGAAEGRNPSPTFDSQFYLTAHPDVAASGMNPLVHYLLHGEFEGRHRFPGGGGAIAAAETMILPGLFEGSNFHELAISDSHALSRLITQSATPAEKLARASSELYSPLISIIIPVYNTPSRFFREVLQSVFAQTYSNWELCLVDDGSSSDVTIAIFEEMEQSADTRVRTRRMEINSGIARASHAALELAKGEFVAFLDHDDLLTPNALSEVIESLRADADVDFIYTDHVMIDRDGYPKYYAEKPAWSPEFLLSTNYIVHFKVVRRGLLVSLGGLRNEVDNVQDLGMTCTLAGAGARIRHLPKPLYLWREHGASVAFSSAAKPGIENLLIQVYDRYLAQSGIAARQTWPDVVKVDRTGVFRLEFTGNRPTVALIVLSRTLDEDEQGIRARFAPLMAPWVQLHIVTLGQTADGLAGIAVESDAAMLRFIHSLDAEIIAFASATGQYIGVNWLDRIVGYAAMDPMIGAAGGKVLDPWLQIRSGGMLSDEAGEYRTIAGGGFDNARSHWFIGQIASNVDAVSSQMMATRRSTLIEMGGIKFHEFGDAAGVAYSAALIQKGYRIVYDPHARHCDAGRLAMPASAGSKIRELGRRAAPMRRYLMLSR